MSKEATVTKRESKVWKDWRSPTIKKLLALNPVEASVLSFWSMYPQMSSRMAVELLDLLSPETKRIARDIRKLQRNKDRVQTSVVTKGTRLVAKYFFKWAEDRKNEYLAKTTSTI